MEKITFEYRKFPFYTAVALNEQLSYFATKVKPGPDGQPKAYIDAMTVKDCRNIDGCVYFAKGRVSDAEMVRMIELFQKAKQEKGWKEIKPFTKQNSIIL